MPELLEVEAYRNALTATIGATITDVAADALVCGMSPGPCPAVGGQILGVRRHGKLLLIDLDRCTIGIHARMTGTIVVDGVSPFPKLRYAPAANGKRFVRLCATLDDGRDVELHDPRRLARVVINPDLSTLGPDATVITRAQVQSALGPTDSTVALKARLLDQSRIAGLGNLLIDEICFQARLDPSRPASSLSQSEVGVLAKQIPKTLRELGRKGGSDTGALQEFRHRGSTCPRCGAPLSRQVVGGRTTYWCGAEQR
jgi:formamidopyrimidine-DNA glycosylase